MRKHNYVIGYRGNNQVAYGKNIAGKDTYVELLTLFQAKRMSKNTFTIRGNNKVPTVVYKLIEIEEKKT
jgi:hypothetical protein